MAGAQTDPYSILGVPRDASGKTIKSAYRRLAQAHHPDRNQDDRVAEERFKDITEAYKCLQDPEKRARYDRMGPPYTEDGRPPRAEDINEVVGNMFNNIFRRRGKDRGGGG